MLRSIVGTNATVLRDLAVLTNAIVLRDRAQHKIEAGADVHTELLQGGRTRVCRILMTAPATILALIPLALSSDHGLIAANLATVVIGDPLAPAHMPWRHVPQGCNIDSTRVPGCMPDRIPH
jgi:Cu/Ag efflux pump CusA